MSVATGIVMIVLASTVALTPFVVGITADRVTALALVAGELLVIALAALLVRRAEAVREGRRAPWRRLAAVAVVGGGIGLLGFAATQWHAHRALDRAERLIGRGDYRAAAGVLLRTATRIPDDARVQYDLGRAYAGLGVRAAAVNAFRAAVRLAPREPGFHEALGRVYRDLGDTPAAHVELEKAAHLAPTEARVQVDLAGLLLDEGHTRRAVQHLRDARQLAPGALEVRMLLATALGRAGDRAGMIREYRAVSRHAGSAALGELARQQLVLISSDERSAP